jgi:hypothetical protein
MWQITTACNNNFSFDILIVLNLRLLTLFYLQMSISNLFYTFAISVWLMIWQLEKASNVIKQFGYYDSNFMELQCKTTNHCVTTHLTLWHAIAYWTWESRKKGTPKFFSHASLMWTKSISHALRMHS